MTCAFPSPGDRFAEQYSITREIGRGGFARVFLGVQERLDRPVAIKVIDPDLVASNAPNKGGDTDEAGRLTANGQARRRELVARFKLEARLVSQLHSPHTVAIHDFGQSANGLLYMVMEYVDGVSFDRLEGPIAAHRVIGIMKQVLSGLSEAHRAGILHRDLKPANLVLFDHGDISDQVKLLDFGVAKLLDSQNPARRGNLTQRDVAIGTPRYMSPEQVMGSPLDARSDIYGFGHVVYELLAGRRAIDINDPVQVLAAHVRGDSFALPADSDVPDGLRRVVDKMLQKDPSKRYISAEAVLRDLDRLEANGHDAQAYAFGASRPRVRLSAVSPRLLGMVATAGLVLVMTALMVAGSGGEPRSDQRSEPVDLPRIPGQPVDFSHYVLEHAGQKQAGHAALGPWSAFDSRYATPRTNQTSPSATDQQSASRATSQTEPAQTEPAQHQPAQHQPAQHQPATKKRRHHKRRRDASKSRFKFVPLE